ncbi:putative lipoprotein [Cupriavidus sp. U2]|uniref:DUF4136 domain-containing protein n=1 Tax=Cupriavidus sp. U2 TaxID=2920269 RepID=UPI001E6280A1|nr:DUF4136 domain-containing protein [Cupriavidus sp. U2]KAI3589401.1 putative lipoprotein [Cupriavidus sp. U2]
MSGLMMSRVPAALGTVLAAALAGCATGPDIRTDYNHSTDFSQYRTFAFLPRLGTDRQGYESLTTQYLKDAVYKEMTARGYEYAPRQPDLLVNFNMQFQQKIVSSPAPMPPPGYMGYYAYRGGLYAPWPGYGFYSDTYTYTEGTLNIDLVDARRNQLVWEGVAQGDASQPERQTSQLMIEQVVGQIFARYPFRAGIGAPGQ